MEVMKFQHLTIGQVKEKNTAIIQYYDYYFFIYVWGKYLMRIL